MGNTFAYGNGGAVTGSASNYAQAPMDAPPSMPMVALELDKQQKVIAHMHEVISDLEMRLSSVLRPVPPDVAGTNAKEGRSLVPLAANLSEQNSALVAACYRLESINGRIEL